MIYPQMSFIWYTQQQRISLKTNFTPDCVHSIAQSSVRTCKEKIYNCLKEVPVPRRFESISLNPGHEMIVEDTSPLR